MDPEMREALDQLGTNLRGEVRSVDAGLREALNQVVVDLRAEIRSGDAETRAYVDERLQASSSGLLRQIGEQVGEQIREQIRGSEERTRRHFDVVGESLRSDIRAAIEGMAASREQTDRRSDEEAKQRDSLAGRVLRLEARVTDLEDGGKPRRSRRQR